MVGLLDRLASLLPKARRRTRPVRLEERFAHFRAVGAANDAFLASLASLQDSAERGASAGLGAVAAAYETLSAPVGAMVKSLIAMSGGRYESLLRRYEALDRDLSLEVLKSRPIEYGALIAWPTDEDATRPQVVGPKAARLAELSAGLGFSVPPFFAVTIYGYRLFMEASGVQDLVNERLWAADLRDIQELEEFSEAITAAILAAEVPAELANAITEAHGELTALGVGWRGVAVRSSAVVEDAQSSFAGQFETVLNVGADDLLAAYRRVVASKYRLEAQKYALARGFVDDDVAMPVLVMAMVPAAAAGVAYSRAPEREDCVMVTAVRGLAQPVVDGRVVPDVMLISKGSPPHVESSTLGLRPFALRCGDGGGLVEASETGSPNETAVSAEVAVGVARSAWALEHHFGAPQDVEWAVDDAGALFIVQTRPLHIGEQQRPAHAAVVEGYRVLVRGAVRAAGGAACGRVFRCGDPTAPRGVPERAVLVVPTTSPRLSAVIGTVSALVAEAGSATGHMATVAREFGVPCLVGATGAMSALRDGALITVDAWNGLIYEGEVSELLGNVPVAASGRSRDPVRESLDRLLEWVSPLTLTDPDSPSFRPVSCKTLHDIARFVHQRSMAEMFAIEGLEPRDRRHARQLAWKTPMNLLLLDLGGGLAADAQRFVPLEKVTSVPMLALLEGMTDPRLRWSGPVGFDLKGFMSVVVRSAADDQRYGEPSYAILARDFAHFASRLAYHFATVESVCGRLVNENYARFLFYGGAAVAERRELRAHFLATVLRYNRFAVKQVGDRVEAVLAKRGEEEIEESLVMLGRLMVASRHLDMVMDSRATAEVLAQAFLSGDYDFDRVRLAEH